MSRSLFAQSVNQVCGCDVRSPATVRHPLIPRVQKDAPAHRTAFACVRAYVCHGRCVFFAEVAYNNRLPPPRLPLPKGQVVPVYIITRELSETPTSVYPHVCNAPIDTTPDSDRRETRGSCLDREFETNGRVGFCLDRLQRPETRLWRPEIRCADVPSRK